jgi:hypothetical protein
MTNEMREHLKQVEAAIQNSKPILEKHAADFYMQNKRTLMVLCFISQMFEHHEATLVLLMDYGSIRAQPTKRSNGSRGKTRSISA